MTTTLLQTKKVTVPLYGRARTIEELFGIKEGMLRRLVRAHEVRCKKTGRAGGTTLYRVRDVQDWCETDNPAEGIIETRLAPVLHRVYMAGRRDGTGARLDVILERWNEPPEPVDPVPAEIITKALIEYKGK